MPRSQSSRSCPPEWTLQFHDTWNIHISSVDSQHHEYMLTLSFTSPPQNWLSNISLPPSLDSHIFWSADTPLCRHSSVSLTKQSLLGLSPGAGAQVHSAGMAEVTTADPHFPP